MRRAAALLSALCVMAPAFGGESLSMREYEKRCASYYARQYGVPSLRPKLTPNLSGDLTPSLLHRPFEKRHHPHCTAEPVKSHAATGSKVRGSW
jgi:hypothetical protein